VYVDFEGICELNANVTENLDTFVCSSLSGHVITIDAVEAECAHLGTRFDCIQEAPRLDDEPPNDVKSPKEFMPKTLDDRPAGVNDNHHNVSELEEDVTNYKLKEDKQANHSNELDVNHSTTKANLTYVMVPSLAITVKSEVVCFIMILFQLIFFL
jgi:hypothetical protein